MQESVANAQITPWINNIQFYHIFMCCEVNGDRVTGTQYEMFHLFFSPFSFVSILKSQFWVLFFHMVNWWWCLIFVLFSRAPKKTHSHLKMMPIKFCWAEKSYHFINWKKVRWYFVFVFTCSVETLEFSIAQITMYFRRWLCPCVFWSMYRIKSNRIFFFPIVLCCTADVLV